MRVVAYLLASLACAGLASPAMAAPEQKFRTEYSIIAFGLPVAQTSFETSIGERSYAMNGSLRTVGLVQVFAATKGSINASGSFSDSRISAQSFAMRYTSGDKTKRTDIGFSRGNVTSSTSVPPPKAVKAPDWVPVSSAHLRGVTDPISALVIPARNSGEVCRRTLRVYDGEMRVDIKLSYLRTIPFSTKGFKGDAVTCSGRFVPVSGYPKGKKEIRQLRDTGRIEVSFAPIAETGLYAPVSARIRTSSGTFSVRASRFEALTR
ncbi:MAG TPA: DUF3108 domain-containing protein [Rhizobiaceae bacterium]|nr:DUF3108 domain-containing protein [Rhizobiaceae bacterium]